MKIKQILPLEHNFTKKLEGIAVMPKMLYYYGELPSASLSPDSGAGVLAPVGLRPSASQGAVVTGLDPYGSAVACAMPQNQEQNDTPGGTPKITPGGECTQGGSPSPSVEKSVATDFSNASLQGGNFWGPSSVAIVGARRNTPYGEDVAYRMAYELARQGVVVVSGLAYGIDAIAHRGALAAGGVTVGVLGTPIDRIYPTRNLGLAREMIEKGGAVISEYKPGTEMHAWRFLERNRIISGLADAVVVVEANVKSGSLNTATHALEQGRELFAVPGDINRPLSRGCNRLIMQGANPYTGVEDVLNFLFPGAKKDSRQRQLPFGDNPDETALLRALAGGINSGEEILRKTGMTVEKYNQTVTMLEIKGRIRSLGMNKWTLS